MAPNIASPAFPYGPGGPTVNGRDWTNDRALKDPTFIFKTLQDLTSQQFLTDFLFTETPVPSGALLYDRVTDQDLYVDVDPNLQPGSIEPGSEFPMVAVNETAPVPASTTKFGGKFEVSYEQVRRDRRDVIGRGLTKLRNTLLRMDAARALNALLGDADIVKVPWTGTKLNAGAFDGTDVAKLFSAQVAMINNDDLGYSADTVIMNPMTASYLVGAEKIWSRLPRENPSLNPLLSNQLNGLLALNWVLKRSCPADTAIFTQTKVVGTIGRELPLYTRQVDEPKIETWTVMAGKVDVPVITDPLSTRVMTGLV